MIQLADNNLVPSLKNLWQLCFGDEDRYINFIFQDLLTPQHVLVQLEDGGLVSAMLCFQPMEIAGQDGQQLSAAYVFAVATHPDYQGRGLSTRLMDALHLLLADRGYSASVLVPASERLFTFYQKRGYESFSPIQKAELSPGDIPIPTFNGVLTPARLENQKNLRETLLQDTKLHVRWDRGFLKAITGECHLSGGEVLRYSGGGCDGFAVCYRDGEGGVVVKELLVPPKALQDCLAAIHTRFKAHRYNLYLRADETVEFSNSILPFSLIRWYDKGKKHWASLQQGAPIYIAHVLD